MEARIIRGKPRTTLKGQPVWQLETRAHARAAWTRLFGDGHTSTRVAELKALAKNNGFRMVEDLSTDWG